MHITRKFNILLVISILLFLLTSCFDLGNAYTKVNDSGTHAEEEPYYNCYNGVYILDEKGSKQSYKMSDFYNKETINNLECPIEAAEYTYLGVEVKKELNIGNVAIYFNSNVSTLLGISFYVVDEMPSDITYVDNLGVTHNYLDSDEPSTDSMVGELSKELVANKWTGTFLQKWKSIGRLKVKKDQILLIRFENNCYDRSKKELDKYQTEMDEAFQIYQTDFNDYNAKLAGGNQNEIAAAKTKMDVSLANYNKAKTAYDNAYLKYEEEKSPYTTRISMKITDILINAE